MSAPRDESLSDYESTPLDRLLDRPIAFQRAFLGFGAGVTGALLLSQAFYWSKRTSDAEKWFYKSREEWEEETGLSRYEQEGARKNLVKSGVLEEKKKGVPCKLFYRVNIRIMLAVLLGEIPQTSRRENHKLAGVKPTGKRGVKAPAITETTAKTSSETSAFTGEAAASTGGEVIVAGKLSASEKPKSPMVIEAGGKTFQIPGELKYPGAETKSHRTWINYAIVYEKRYGTWPVWNRTVGGMLTKFIERIGAELAPKVAAFYVTKVNDTFVTKGGHSIKLLLSDAEKYHTQYQTGRTVTNTQAQQIDKTQTNLNAADEALEISRARRAARGVADAHG